MTIEEQIKEIEEEISNTKYNKATQHHIGKLKAKLARLREEAEARSASKGGGRGYALSKSGNATVAIVGLPSCGKSTLLNQLTEAESEVGHFDFTTLTVVPGTLHHRGANIQLLDLPGLIEGASKGKGRGREVLSVVRTADLILLLMDVYRPEIDVLVRELHIAGLRLNEREADIVITPRNRGGINVRSTVKLTILDDELVVAMVRAYGLVNADVVLRQDVDEDQLIDYLQGNRRYVRAMASVNKIDAVPEEVWGPVVEDLEGRDFPVVPISADKGTNLDLLKDTLFDNLDLMRIYMRPRGGETDYEEPLIIRRGATVRNVCDTIHREIKRKFRFAKVWGDSAKFPGQSVGLDHILTDGDVITIVQRK
ncbi:MAG: GTP-binding protein [Thermoplasmata archaeon]|nr:MAG: GTP-binding protein [Thermoplasmata archaeon]